ncbi:hypothetical protein PFLUV_G00058500 [Perca fluviatilis]|uniref:Uncharacterized protein n=1 Tax=Perca fluviatilis TaxID=8168 RepID=A0A6A5FF70_PERFL|nr:hypothetical protein PFLUV_G00058500 [Perca fluviatilis]
MFYNILSATNFAVTLNMQKTWVRVRLSSTIYGSNFEGNVVAFEAEAYAILGEEASSAHQTFPATASSVCLINTRAEN